MQTLELTKEKALALVGAITPEQIEAVASELLHYPQVECPLTHVFTPGVYYREIFMPAGSLIIGHEHKTKHSNIVLSGRALVMIQGREFMLEAPHQFVSEPGVRKVLFILEDMRFATIHPNPDDETDLEILGERFIVKSPAFLQYHQDVKRLLELAPLLNE